MKKFLLSIFAVMLAVFSVQAEEVTKSVTFSNYTAGTQYANNEKHDLGDGLVIYTTECHFTSELRIYSSSTHNGYVVSDALPGTITKMTFNAGNKADNLDIYGSNDGVTWTKVGQVNVTSTSYKDYSFTFSGSYTRFKLDVEGTNQVRLKSMSVTYTTTGEGGGTVEPEPDPEPETPVTPEEPEFLTPGTYVDKLNREYTGAESTAVSAAKYISWTKEASSSNAVYVGQSAGGNDAIQLRTTNSNSGIVTTVSGGKAKKVSIEWNGTSTRTLNIYGKNEPYESPTDLYDNNKQGTLLGTIVGGRSTELTISGDYKYIGLRSNSGAMYLNWIEITWEVEPASYTLAVGETRYSTLSLGYDATIPQGAKAYVVSEVNSGYVTLEEVTGVIPAKEAVIIEATPGNYNFVQTTEGAAVVGENLLEGTRVDTYVAEEAYVLWNVNGEACFCKADMTNGSFLNKANKAYLPASVANGAASYSFRFGEGTTGIDEMTEQRAESKEIYDLTGRKVEAITAPGIYIVNGVKRVVR